MDSYGVSQSVGGETAETQEAEQTADLWAEVGLLTVRPALKLRGRAPMAPAPREWVDLASKAPQSQWARSGRGTAGARTRPYEECTPEASPTSSPRFGRGIALGADLRMQRNGHRTGRRQGITRGTSIGSAQVCSGGAATSNEFSSLTREHLMIATEILHRWPPLVSSIRYTLNRTS